MFILLFLLLFQGAVKPMSSEMNAIADYQSSESETENVSMDQSNSSNRRPKKLLLGKRYVSFTGKKK